MKEKPETRPNFLYIGPDKSGSTWLFHVLSRHPECYVPAAKDIYFFDRYYDRGLEWYLSFFKDAPPKAKAIGELSHDYLFSAQAASRIARDLPCVRLVTNLRNPVERTFSHYLYLVRSGKTNQSFEIALEQFPELIDNSLYAKHLSAYFREFRRANIRVLFFDRLQRFVTTADWSGIFRSSRMLRPRQKPSASFHTTICFRRKRPRASRGTCRACGSLRIFAIPWSVRFPIIFTWSEAGKRTRASKLLLSNFPN